MKIRRILVHEVPFLSEMLYEAIFVPEGAPKLPASIIQDPSLSRYIDGFGKAHHDICFVVEDNGALIGAVWGRLWDEDNKGYGFVDVNTPELSIAIKRQYRGRGLGTKLIQRLMKAYQNLGVSAVSLSVDKANTAFNLYQKMGFAIVSETKKSAVMQMALSDQGNN